MSTKRERLVNALKAMTAADMVAYGMTEAERGCVFALLEVMGRFDGSVVTQSGERFSGKVVDAVKAKLKIGAIKQFREETNAPLKDAKEAVERLQAHLGIKDAYSHLNGERS